MKVVILAGGYGTRLSEETSVRPKPMVEIGEMPMIWHIMKTYAHYGLHDFIICCGYKGYMIKEFFAAYVLRTSDVTVDIEKNTIAYHHAATDAWRVTMIDTGDGTMTGGRLRRVRHLLTEGTFCMTYGDGVSDIDVRAVVDFHRRQNTLATLTAVQPPGRFGAFTLSKDTALIRSFREKPRGDGAWINGGFFVLEPEVIDYIDGDATTWEKEPLTRLAHEGQLSAYKHEGFWQSMDSLRDKMVIEELWNSGNPPWKVW